MHAEGCIAVIAVRTAKNAPTTSSSSSSSSSGGVLIRNDGMQHLLCHWLFPPPTEMELYKTASRVLAEESKNLVKTLDYLGL